MTQSEPKPVPPPGLPGRQLGTSYFGFTSRTRPEPPAWAGYLVRVGLALAAIGIAASFVDGWIQGSTLSDEGKGDGWCIIGSASQDPLFDIAWRWGCWAGADEEGGTSTPGYDPSPTANPNPGSAIPGITP
ncbi:hypothetical protein [Streptomyces sp. NPDC089799]|uniref:hypothetical protein n=1 Tax=Streptomyces sp. NPDC089799 TaxID=3155066 RepID=UPI0034209FB0